MGIAEEIQAGVPGILNSWRGERAVGVPARLEEGVGRILVVFTEFLRSPAVPSEFGRDGTTRALVEEIAAGQHVAGRDAVGVIEDYAALRRCVWRFVEERVDLSALDGGEVSRFFAKLLEASDWVTEAGLEAFEAFTRRDMESALGRAAATDLLTGLPDRDLFNRQLLPGAVAEHDRVALVVFGIADSEEEVAREGLLRLADVVGEVVPEEAARARFGDDEICAILPGMDAEDAYRIAEEVLGHLKTNGPEDLLLVDAGVASYPDHGVDASEVVSAAIGALHAAKRFGGNGIVVAH